MRELVRRHSLAAFVALAYGISWALWLPLLVRGAVVTPGGSVTHFPGLLGPAVAAFVVTGFVDGRPGVARLAQRLWLVSKPTWRFLAYALAPVVILVAALLGIRLTGRQLPPLAEFALYSGLPALGVLPVFLLVLVFNGFGEETGWRGFALGRFQRRFGPLRGVLLVALVWAGWHLPSLWFVEGYRTMGPAMLVGGFGLGLTAGAIVLARVLNRTGGSILAAALWHATYNLGAATAASRGPIGAITTTCVMAWASFLLVAEFRHRTADSLLSADPAA